VKNENQAVILVYSTSHALRAEKLLKEAGIECRLTPVPRRLSSDCGICVRIDRADRDRAERVLDKAVGIEGIHDI